MIQADTIAAIATPPGTGGIGIIRASGPDAERIGQTLDALQYVVNKILSKQGRENKQVIVDTEDYRKKREEALVSLAEKVSQKVRKTKKPVTLGNMTARERRIIHLALQNDDTVVTMSRGEGHNRKIIVRPSRRSGPHGPRPPR